jgi:hypothetical protein
MPLLRGVIRLPPIERVDEDMREFDGIPFDGPASPPKVRRMRIFAFLTVVVAPLGLAFFACVPDDHNYATPDGGADASADGATNEDAPSGNDGGDAGTGPRVSVFDRSICIRTETGVKCRGENHDFILGIEGDGGNVPTFTPQSPALPGVVQSLILGPRAGGAIINREAFLWGSPDITSAPTASATKVKFQKGKVLDVSIGLDRGCVRVDEGAYCWGGSESVPGFIAVASVIAVGDGHSCVIAKKDDKPQLLCWGDNRFNQLGPWPVTPDCPGDRTRWCSLHPISLNGETPIDVASSSRHICALTDKNRVYCLGLAEDGQSGLPTNGPCSSPGPDGGASEGCHLSPNLIPLPATRKVLKVVATWRHSCALLDKAPPDAPTVNALCWGNGSAIKTAASGTPAEYTKQGIALDIEQISVGGSSTCVVADGKVYCNGAIVTAPGADPQQEPLLVEP